MPETVVGLDPVRLERSCTGLEDAIRFGAAAPGIEFAEARFRGRAFDPHRHDTYAIGVTLAGVQAFGYRGTGRICRPGQLHVLHPDEVHDGAAATPAGFAYRIVYVEPALVQQALDGRALPFVADPVVEPSPRTAAVAALLADIDEPVDDLRRSVIVTELADLLYAVAGGEQPARIDRSAVEDARRYLAADPRGHAPAGELERVTGLDRYALARQFRRAFGTSPDRYRLMRRLGLARSLIAAGTPLAGVAAEAGFADQSHLTRQFKSAYGMTPARFARAVRGAAPEHVR